MDNEIAVISEPVALQTSNTPPKKKTKPLLRFTRDLLAVAFWFYVIIKLFVYDIDVLALQYLSPKYLWILNYKFFILAGVLAIIWLLTKNKNIILNALYICFFPFVVLFWKLPYFVFRQKSWVFAFSVINSTISFFKSVKYNFIVATAFAISFVVIMKSSNHALLFTSAAAISIVLILAYIHRAIIVFKPSSIFQIHKKIFSGIYEHGKRNFGIDDTLKVVSVEQLDKVQLKQWISGLQSTVLFNKVCLFTAKKLRDYQNSKIYIISYVISLCILVFITALSFTSINFALFKIDAASFQVSNSPSVFTFFYYSFNKLFFNSISEILPFSNVAQILSMAEMFFAFFIGVIFVVLLFSVRSEKYASELNSAISSIEHDGRLVESIIIDEYKLAGIDAAIQELIKVQSDLVGFIQKISRAIDDA